MVSKREKIMLGALVAILGPGITILGLGNLGIMPAATSIGKKLVRTGELEIEAAALDTQIQNLKAKKERLEKLDALPENLVVRVFKPDTFQENIKQMMDQVVTISTNHGNDLISLEPWEVPGSPPQDTSQPQPSQPPSPQHQPESTVNANPSDSTKIPPQLKTYGYSLTIRGAYDSIAGFIRTLNEHNELIEIYSLKMENEAGADRSLEADSPIIDPFKPIKLNAKLILFLQPQ